jgi:hypothetical protein
MGEAATVGGLWAGSLALVEEIEKHARRSTPIDDSLTATRPAHRETMDNGPQHNVAYLWGFEPDRNRLKHLKAHS